MKKFILTSTICTIFFLLCHAQDETSKYNVANIDNALLKNADVVVRNHELNFEVINNEYAIETEHVVLTILNRNARGIDNIYLPYDNLFTSIENIEAYTYDASGKVVKKLKKKDITDFKPYEVFVTDYRVKHLDFAFASYPYTIEYTVVKKTKSLLFYPRFMPQYGPEIALEYASFSITSPDNLRYKEIALPSDASVTKNGQTHTWTLKKMPAVKYQSRTPDTQYPTILTCPIDFKMDAYKGSMKEWSDYGKFIHQLSLERDKLSPEKISFLKSLVSDCNDDYCRVNRIYEHMQTTTRYFSIQLGIGGWQPLDASFVDANKYGDCKALSNYMVSMLKAININASPVIIQAGINREDQIQHHDFPNPFFNHEIAVVHLPNDTIWLECTSSDSPTGYLGSFTCGRPALVASSDGGYLAQTPKYDHRHNIEFKVSKIVISASGDALVNTSLNYSGISYEGLSSTMKKGVAESKKILYEQLSLNNAQITNQKYKINKARLPNINVDLEANISPLASRSGKRLFVPTNTMSKWTKVPHRDSSRTASFYASTYGFTEMDSVTFVFPEGYKIESNPGNADITSDFGSYNVTITEISPTEYLYYRKFVLTDGVFGANRYKEYIDFLSTVAKTDKSKFIIISTEEKP